MARRVGLGPVFAFEWRMASRRWQAYALRALTVLLLLGAMAPVWFVEPSPGETPFARQAQMGEVFYLWTAIILLGLVGLAAPALPETAIRNSAWLPSVAMLVRTMSNAASTDRSAFVSMPAL